MINSTKRLALMFIPLLLVACDEAQEPEQSEVIRAIKHYIVTEPAGGDQRTYSGTLAASDSSALSFAVSGTVSSVEVAIGDAVEGGQILATLDTEPFDLEVQAARADMESAQATYAEKEADVARQRQLFDKGWVARAALEQAVSAFDGAAAQLDFARARLAVAERNLKNTALTAPFSGKIASRDVEPFQEISAGNALFQINSNGALEIDIAVSDTVVNRLNAGASVEVDVATVAGCGCAARIIEIGTTSGTANTVTVTAALLDGPTDLLPGMSAQVAVSLGATVGDPGFLVPLTAIAPGDEAARGYLFIYDQAAKAVRKAPIDGGNGISGNLVAVRGALKPGDIIAAAGVSFLRDGQRVKLLGE